MQIPEIIIRRNLDPPPDFRFNLIQFNVELVNPVSRISIALWLLIMHPVAAFNEILFIFPFHMV